MVQLMLVGGCGGVWHHRHNCSRQQHSCHVDCVGCALLYPTTMHLTSDSTFESCWCLPQVSQHVGLACNLLAAPLPLPLACPPFPLAVQARCEWNLSSVEESGLNSVVFAGMCVGAPVWGMVSDSYGRKTSFFLATLISAVFGFATALAPNVHVREQAFWVPWGVGGPLQS